jgi:hypothetical protein
VVTETGWRWEEVRRLELRRIWMLFDFWRRHYRGEEEADPGLPSGPQPELSPAVQSRLASLFSGVARA